MMIAMMLAVPVSRAEQPPGPTVQAAELKKSPVPRLKPQVIYRLPRVSGYAAALHSQAKTPDNSLPITPDMPVSLQMSRAAANEAANQPSPQPQPSVEQQPPPKMQPTKQSRTRSPNLRSNMRDKGPRKSQGPGNSHGHKSHKK
ncbi:MAG: hypothetical protein LC627_02680 [Verrucomicrobiaceae bacterium]|nr:hypothetical protein [Verrucomicrobiaceae bacterium]